jgi:hypothetical protein
MENDRIKSVVYFRNIKAYHPFFISDKRDINPSIKNYLRGGANAL